MKSDLRALLHRLLSKAYSFLPASSAVALANLVAWVRRKNVYFRVAGEGFISAHEGRHTRYGSELSRNLMFWSNGIESRSQQLFEEYFLDLLPSEAWNPVPARKEGGREIVVDVGANMGDLYLAVSVRGAEYLAFEPSSSVYRGLVKSLPSARIFNLALGEDNAQIDFYLADKTGDSSVIHPASEISGIVSVPQRKLDDINDLACCQRILLIKLEAEGYEPEILRGGLKILKKTMWVAVDGGKERGPGRDSTIEDCTNILLAMGFIMQAINLDSRPGVALFRNLKMTCQFGQFMNLDVDM